MKKDCCVDLDGVIAQYDGWRGVDHFGPPVLGAREFLFQLSEFARVIIYTARCQVKPDDPSGLTADQLKQKVAAYLDRNRLIYDEIYVGQGKPIAFAYIDDRAIACTPMTDARAFPSALVRAKRLYEEEK